MGKKKTKKSSKTATLNSEDLIAMMKGDIIEFENGVEVAFDMDADKDEINEIIAAARELEDDGDEEEIDDDDSDCEDEDSEEVEEDEEAE